jgi:hypothetical protein
VDHIYEFHRGGQDCIENFWIVPAEWNTNCITKSHEMILFIHKWVEKNGRVCLVVPPELLLLQRKAMIAICTEMGLIK